MSSNQSSEETRVNGLREMDRQRRVCNLQRVRWLFGEMVERTNEATTPSYGPEIAGLVNEAQRYFVALQWWESPIKWADTDHESGSVNEQAWSQMLVGRDAAGPMSKFPLMGLSRGHEPLRLFDAPTKQKLILFLGRWVRYVDGLLKAEEAIPDGHIASRPEAIQAENVSVLPARSVKMSREEQRRHWQASALLLLQDHPDFSNTQIASAVGVHPSQLSAERFPAFARMREEQKDGRVSQNGPRS